MMKTTPYNREEAIRIALSVRDEDIDYSDIPEITELPPDAKRGRPFAAQKKKLVSIRLSADVLARLRETGKGWQTRVNDFLREMMMNKRF